MEESEEEYKAFGFLSVQRLYNHKNFPMAHKNHTHSNTLPIGHFIILWLLTLSMYQAVWFGKNWFELKKHKNLDINPILRIIGLFIPILNFYLIYDQFAGIRKIAQGAGVKILYSPILISVVFILMLMGIQLQSPFNILVPLMGFLPLICVQKTLNAYWEKEQPHLKTRSYFTKFEIIMMVLGGCAILIGIFNNW